MIILQITIIKNFQLKLYRKFVLCTNHIFHHRETAYRVKFKAEIMAASEIKQISSPTRSIIVARNEVLAFFSCFLFF